MKITKRQLRLIIEQAIGVEKKNLKYHVLVPAGIEDNARALGLQDAISEELAKHLGSKNELNRDNVSRYIEKNNISI